MRKEDKAFTFTDEITVRQIQSMGGDHMVVAAAKVSINGEEALKFAQPGMEEKNTGLIRYLMRMRHGTPFEHSAQTFFVHAPIFVWREWHRHRIGMSYNEESGRYKDAGNPLLPVFYIPGRKRPMVQTKDWKPGRPKFITLDQFFLDHFRSKTPYDDSWAQRHAKARADEYYDSFCSQKQFTYRIAYESYEKSLSQVVQGEPYEGLTIELDPGLARIDLPVGIYSSCWVTCNPRSLMHFLSLRTHEPEAMFPSYPLYEIELAARVVENLFAYAWPLTYAAFNEFKRVAP